MSSGKKPGGGGSGGGSQRPPPPARAPVPPPAPARRPQVRPIGGLKPPVLRPLNVRAQAPAPGKKPAAAAPPPTAPIASPPSSVRDEFSEAFNEDFFNSLDDDATSVMDRPPAAHPSQPADPPRNQRVVPAAGRPAEGKPSTGRSGLGPPPTTAKPARPAIDVVPANQRHESERTMVMAEAPARPPQAQPQPLKKSPAFPSASPAAGRASPTSRVPPRNRPAPGLPSQARSDSPVGREPAPSVPELEALVPPAIANRRDPKKSPSARSDAPFTFGSGDSDPPPPLEQRTDRGKGQGVWARSAPSDQGTASLPPLGPSTARVRPPSVFPPPQGHYPPPGMTPAPDATVAMHHAQVQRPHASGYPEPMQTHPHYTPSAPPVAPYAPKQPSFPPPGMQPQHFFGPQPHEPHTHRPPAHDPRSIAPGPLGLAIPALPISSLRPSPVTGPFGIEDSAPHPTQGAVGVFGLVLFAAPLALATALIAALALL